MADYKHAELWKSLQNEELDEGDVWEVLRDKQDRSSEEQPKTTTIISPHKKPYLASKSIQIARTSSCSSRQVVQQSAPVKVPDWSKSGKEWKTDLGGDIDDSNGKLPPHEIVARRLARSHISTFSVMEGAGRTLKGRDLSAVREAVLRKTGFIEPT